MPWKTIDHNKLAKKHGIDLETIKVKHALIEEIKRGRLKAKLSQNDLAKLIGKTQSFIAKIESGLGTKNFSFDLLLEILKALGYKYKITTKQANKNEKLVA